ncbi:hypothetical protein K7432_014724 [Basidiobolus ranarum]|uniref:Uncharacterized protein n=1 Tax=Basidiobolus ranarum TaxID=34480 RepID=A0ABR2WHD9_9FUNG
MFLLLPRFTPSENTTHTSKDPKRIDEKINCLSNQLQLYSHQGNIISKEEYKYHQWVIQQHRAMLAYNPRTNFVVDDKGKAHSKSPIKSSGRLKAHAENPLSH